MSHQCHHTNKPWPLESPAVSCSPQPPLCLCPPLAPTALIETHPRHRQDSAAKPASSAKNTAAVLGQDLDSLLGAAAPPAAKQNSDLDDLNLDDLLGPGANSAPPQRYSGGGTAGGGGAARVPPASREQPAQGWGSSAGGQQQQQQRMSYSGEFGAASGRYGDTATAAASKVLKGDQLVSLVEVGDEGACPVEEKDVDPKTVAALKARGIENFTPVQVCVCVLCVLALACRSC